MNIAQVIGWKFDNQPGMRCKEVDGVVTIVKFPGGIPTQEEQGAWLAEYDAMGGDAELEKEERVNFSNVDPFLKAYVLAVNDGSIVPGSNMSAKQLKAAIKAKL